MLRARLLTAVLALPPLIGLLAYAPSWLFSALIFAFTTLGLYEYFAFLGAQFAFASVLGMTWGMVIAGTLLVTDATMLNAVMMGGLFLVLVASLSEKNPQHGIQRVGATLLGVMYVGFLVPHLALLRQMPDGIGWIFFVFLVAMLGDTAGYAVGRTWGKIKLIPHISPGKTVEGSLGSVLGNLSGALCAWLWFFPQRSSLEFVCLGLVAGVLAQVGDLCESAIKRAFGAKDSGRLLPGHGGILDRLDSLLFPAAFIYYYERLLR